MLDRLFPSPMTHPDIIRVGWMRGNNLHNFLVLLYHLARVPLALCGVLVALMAWGAARVQPQPVAAAAVLGGVMAADLALLLALPRLKISYGWVKPPWLMFAAGRALLALPAALLPAGGWALGTLAAVQGLLTVASLYGSLVEPFWVQHTELSFPLPGLAAPLRVLLVTDLHVERLTRRELRLAEAIHRRQPELIILGGDLLNLSYVGEPRAIQECRELLAGMQAPAGVFFVRGTWDVDPPEVVSQILEGLNIRQLANEVAVVEHQQGARLQLVGVTADLPPVERAQRLEQLMSRTAGGPRVVVHHTPDLAPLAARLGADLYLAGHTHGGQICLPLLGPLATGTRLGRRFVRGRHRLRSTSIYVCRGLGLEGLGAPRMRFLARPELVWITLLPADPG